MRRKKNWNILRRLTPFCFLLSTFCMSCDKQEMLYNSWNLQKVTMNGEPLNDSLQFNLIPYSTHYTFYYANSLTVRTFALGQITTSSNGYYQLGNNSTLDMHFTILNRTYDINAKIKKLTKRELNLEYEDNGDNYFLKLFANLN